MARNTYADTVYLDTGKVKDIAAAAAAAAPVTGLTEAEIVEKYDKAIESGTQIVVLARFLPGKLTDAQKQSLAAVEGLGVDNKMYTPIRDYPMGESVAHILGYLGYPKDAPEGSPKVGVAGLEAAYQDLLAGEDGKIVYIRNRWGRNVRTLWEQNERQGEDLRLTIKPDLQKKAYEALSTHLDYTKKQSGVAIVMDAETGYVEAMACTRRMTTTCLHSGFPKRREFCRPGEQPAAVCPRDAGQHPPGSVVCRLLQRRRWRRRDHADTALTVIEDKMVPTERAGRRHDYARFRFGRHRFSQQRAYQLTTSISRISRR